MCRERIKIEDMFVLRAIAMVTLVFVCDTGEARVCVSGQWNSLCVLS